MSLPKVPQPIHTVKIPNTKKEYQYRPFLMKDDKAILNARAIGDDHTIRTTIGDVVQSSVLTKNVDVGNLPFYEVEYLYLKSYSVSNTDRIPVTYTCNNIVKNINEETGEEIEGTEHRCGTQSKNTLNLGNIELVFSDLIDKVIKVNDNITINLEYPGYTAINNFYRYNAVDEETEEFIYSDEEREKANADLIFSSVLNITEIEKDGGAVVRLPDQQFTQEEFFAWLEELPKDITGKLTLFFGELPYIRLKSTMMCTECGNKEDFELIGAKSFLELS